MIATQTHDLKDEMFEKWDRRNVIVSPETPTFSDGALNKELDTLYTLGMNRSAYKRIMEVENDKLCMKYLYEDVQKAREFIESINKGYKAKHRPVLTTHHRALFGKTAHSTIVFDEDVLNLLCEVDSLLISDLRKVRKELGKGMFKNENDDIKTLIQYLENEVSAGKMQELPERFKIDLEKHSTELSKADGFSSNFIGFLESDFFYRDSNNPNIIHFANRHYFPEDKKIIILSATVPTEVYEILYPERVQITDISNVQTKGQITQYTGKSYSRQSLTSALEKRELDFITDPVITFKDFKKHFPSAVPDLHFGKCSGSNDLENEPRLAVIGTPHSSPSHYLL